MCSCDMGDREGREALRGGRWDGEFEQFRRHNECNEAGDIDDHCSSAFGFVADDLTNCDLERGDPARKAWGRLLWRFRKHPRAKEFRLNYAEDCL